MPDVSMNAGIIAGGIDVVGTVLVAGGRDLVVGETAKWSMRDKFLQLKHSTDNSKNMLKDAFTQIEDETMQSFQKSNGKSPEHLINSPFLITNNSISPKPKILPIKHKNNDVKEAL